MTLAVLLPLLLTIHLTHGQVIVSQIIPTAGSVNGATRITIKGQGFAEANQFNYGDGNTNLGNSVQLVSSSLSIPCDVEKDSSHATQITCYTRPMPADYYAVRVSVDGVPVDTKNICSGYFQTWWCMFQTNIYYTPVINSIAPRSGSPGSLITITGKIFTDVYGSNTALSSNGKNVRVLRVYAGGMPCNLLVPNSDTLYGLQLDSAFSDTGSMICYTTGTYVGHHNISFILDSYYGRSLPNLATYFVSSLNKIAMYQTYAVITGVYPSAGSIEGGTIITITGQFFDQTDAPAKVLVGGQECLVLGLTDTTITCRTPPRPDVLPALFPGSRGLKMERWNATFQMNNVVKLNENSTGYAGASWFDGSSRSWPLENNAFSARFSGFFVPPETDYYTFYIRGDDEYALYFNETGDPAGKVQIASGYYTASYFTYSSQKSKTFLLQKGNPCYFEAYFQNYYGPAGIDVGLYKQKSSYTDQQTPDAVNEVQAIQSRSDAVLERQIITLQNWSTTQQAVNEVQTVTVTKYCISPCAPMYYTLAYGTEETGPLSADASAADIQSALNQLWSIQPDTVIVNQETSDAENAYNVTFVSQRGDFQLLTYRILSESNITVDIEEKTQGVSDMKTFTLVWDNVYSKPVAANASSAEVQSAILDMVGAQCPEVIAKRTESLSVKYFRNYETDFTTSSYRGFATNEAEAFCGRYSLKNPSALYDSTETKLSSQTPYGSISLTLYSKLCFAYKGLATNSIGLSFQYEDSSSLGKVTSINTNFNYNFVQGNSWTYTCIDLLSLLKTKYSGRNFNVLTISLASLQNYYVDVLYIGQTVTTSDLNVVRRRPALSNNGIVLSNVNVDSTVYGASGSQYTITITPYNCGYNFPLFAVGFAKKMQNSSGMAIYGTSSWTLGSSIQINRTQTASPPIGGTFSIQAYGKEIKGLAVDISAVDLKYALETIPDMGQVSILSSSGSCRGYTSQIKFLTVTGYQPLLQVNDSTVTGFNAAVSAVKISSGGLFRQHLLGDLLRTVHDTPQVEVYINGLPSNCSGNCGYSWRAEQTPVITSMNTDLSWDNELLIINGTGFSNSTANDTTSVTIGNISCTILSLTANDISCLVQKASAGMFPVTVYIAEVGFAVSSGVNLTFTHQITVSSIEPSSGSLAGGTLVTIFGMGFSNDSTVEFGSSPCNIIFVNLSTIQCRATAGSLGTFDVAVSTNGLNGALPNAFNYTSLSAPTITAISPTSSSVLGNTTLTVSGFNFSGQTASSAVLIGNYPCHVLEWTSTNITCLLPVLPPGTYAILVEVESWGFAISKMANDASIIYILEVNSIFPQYGSLYGGSQITVTGSGFSSVPMDNVVTIGSLPCIVSVSSDSELTCEIQRPGNVFNVTNDGKDTVYGVGYAWSPKRLDISTGDTVVWQWQSQPFILGIGYRVFSVSGPSNLTYDGISFNSGARTPSGVFSYQFTSPGTYYYSSGYVNDGQTIFLQGTIDVSPISDHNSAVNVSVGRIEANYIPDHLSPSVPEGCTTPDPPCPQLTNVSSSNHSFSFGFSSCYSPLITSITPTSGTIHDSITINGTGFSNLKCSNKVLVGPYPCVVSSADETSIACKVDPRGSMDIGVAEMVSLRVNNHGNAINALINEMQRRFALLPHIDYVTPANGSTTGSTRITIHGSGFSNTNGSTTVTGLGCTILSVNYTDIICDTLPSYPHSVDVEVTVKGIPSQCKGSCSYMFSTAMTPGVSSVYPDIIRNTLATFYVSGLGFGTDVNDVAVYVGNNSLNVMAVNDTDIICAIDPVPAGNYPVMVIVHSKGLAQGSFTINSPAEATVLTASGSVLGGTLLRIQGNGFHLTYTTVRIDGNLCPIKAVTPGSVDCVTPPSAAAKTATVNIYIPAISYPPLSFLYSEDDTPKVTSVLPNTGPSGTTIIVSGSLFGLDASKIKVTIGNAACGITEVSDSQLNCTVGDNWGGTFPVTVINEKGFARSSAAFTYELSITSISPNQGSFGGGLVLTISGSGFAEQLSKVLVCNSACTVDSVRSNASLLFCEVPMNNDTNTTSKSCNVQVMNGNYTVQINNSFSYSSALTPFIYDVTPKRGGTAGGTRLTITGLQFSTNTSRITVTIAQTICKIQSSNSTQIVCITSAQSPSQRAKVRVYIEDQGIAKLDNADFFYIDVWSSKYTWGGETPPDEGSLAVITKGQTILLDQSTPVLKMLLIQGNVAMFHLQGL